MNGKRLQFPDTTPHGESRNPHSRSASQDLKQSPLILSPALSHSSPYVAARPRPRLLSNSSATSADTHGSAPFSPGKSEAGLSPIRETNPRVERKITDLEISNSSLLAINRTLEREMRKQNAELRRFRRFSRAGGLSMFEQFRSSLPAVSDDNEEEEEESGDGLSGDSDDDGSGTDESGRSHETNGLESDARLGIGGGAKKVYIDLAWHQELLSGSRKINNSLKWSLLRTDEMIKSGRKALEYKVQANALGGRVLPPEELSDDEESSHDLLNATSGVDTVGSELHEADMNSNDQAVE